MIDSGATALFLATERGDLSIMEILLEAGADPTVSLRDGTTTLHAAALGTEKHIKALKLLLKYNSTPEFVNATRTSSKGVTSITPLHMAADVGKGSHLIQYPFKTYHEKDI
jgi:ankyrin repeat protein